MNDKHVISHNWNTGSIEYSKIPRKIKKAEKKLIIQNTDWKPKECIIRAYTRNFRGRLGFHKVSHYNLGF